MEPFSEGFVTFEKDSADSSAIFLHKPVVFLSKGGYAIFNNGSMLLLTKNNPEIKALRLGYNPHTKMLAIKAEKEHIGYPTTVRLSRVGDQRRTGQISFRSLAGLFDIQFTGKRYRLVYNKVTGTATVDLAHPMAPDEKAKRMRMRKTVGRKLEEVQE